MAPYHIRKYQEGDRQRVLDLFSRGMTEHVPATYRHILKLPQTLVLLLGLPLTLFLASGSWLLAVVAGLMLLASLILPARHHWNEYVVSCLHADLADITKTYFSGRGSCFWVAESEGQVVGMVGALPIKEPTMRKKQLQLLHLSVSVERRGQGIARALVRTLLQFARDQSYHEVVLGTCMLQFSAIALYQSMGFQKTHQYFHSMAGRLIALPIFQFTHRLPSAQVSEAS
ncbi:N-acetyltransferase 8 [Pteronotus mesoamericanus]|uniref:N-acetyltransferase 8 n=1 Tax=Pteronotus mesoamericanus TaxID=1884717 RepID=UPI0023EC43CB|nr:N-acetyltransferase 8 [Pteronotus parnellii mesoamericanus]XP_054449484.1 N-acetyltransferase 8 [Pteronotus parnellii mesoamericanus]XP_054449485.1 N-acetyltransferase 8 [Pteronotus parnellii mesoamericanus]XP_054449486.1 N-acetyltransferase 8 [Pteronotus parnellii mesoamericanus]XP_054449487.1 N-acetyltransferase 8 [Pteronotus parnellii mesoamericanus]